MFSMAFTTTIAVKVETRDELRAVADRNNVSLDEQIRRLLRLERQRRMGEDLREGRTEDLELLANANRATIDALR